MISYYENHAAYPAADIVVALAEALDVSTDELLGVRAVRQRRAAPAQRDEAHRLWKRFQRVQDLPEKDQRAVFRLIQSLASVREARSGSLP